MKVISEKRRMNKLDINVSIKSKSLILEITKYAYGKDEKTKQKHFWKWRPRTKHDIF
jgi:hypothetical protein